MRLMDQIRDNLVPKKVSELSILLIRINCNLVQLNKYKTTPYFFLLNLKIYMWLLVDFCVFDWICLIWTLIFLNIKIHRIILGSDQANSVKSTEINKQSQVKFWFNRKNMELSCTYLLRRTFLFLEHLGHCKQSNCCLCIEIITELEKIALLFWSIIL